MTLNLHTRRTITAWRSCRNRISA